MSAAMRFLALLAMSIILASCSTTSNAGFIPKGKTYEPRAADHPIVVYDDQNLIEQPYKILGEVYVSKEAHLRSFDLAKMLEELKIEARAVGADALINVKNTRSSHLEANSYVVEATAIRYND